MTEEHFLTIPEAAERLRVSRNAAYHVGELLSIVRGGPPGTVNAAAGDRRSRRQNETPPSTVSVAPVMYEARSLTR